MKIKYCLLNLLFCSSAALALEQQAQLWLDASLDDSFKRFPQLNYVLEAQTRFVDEENYYELIGLSGGLGYRSTPTLSFWSGYEWTSPNVIHDTSHENQIWEQMIWQLFNNDTLTVRTRTRLEQINRVHEPQWNMRLREKLSLYFPNGLWNKYTPLIYNEVFVNINNPEWTSQDTLEQNRLFMGLDIPITKKSFLEAGYIQQYLFNDSGNALHHVLYVGFNVNPNAMAVTQYVR